MLKYVALRTDVQSTRGGEERTAPYRGLKIRLALPATVTGGEPFPATSKLLSE
jgi:hypothetical protein